MLLYLKTSLYKEISSGNVPRKTNKPGPNRWVLWRLLSGHNRPWPLAVTPAEVWRAVSASVGGPPCSTMLAISAAIYKLPNLENSRKTAEKGAEWVTAKQPKNSRKNSRNTRKTDVMTVSAVFRLFFGCFTGTLSGTHSAPFAAVFQLFSMSGI